MNLKPLAFLQAVLPVEGHKVAAVIQPSGALRHKFFLSFEEMAAYISTQDGLGLTAYHACASYKVPEMDPRGTPRKDRTLGRTHHNVLAAKAFWLDIDYGPQHAKPSSYRDGQDAVEATQSFCRAAGLPAPVFVGSGHGVHVYWPLDAALDAPRWAALAGGLRQLCVRHGLEADAVRTADICSILRTPGTHNRKGSVEKIVEAGPLQGPYPLNLFRALHEAQGPVNATTHPGASSGRRSLVAAAINVYGSTPDADPALATQACQQLRAVLESEGNVSEPHWYAALGVWKHCVDGEAYAHEASKGYQGYTHAETQTRLERAGEFGPTTCEKFAGVNPQGCQGCPFAGTIKSPIQTGRREARVAVLPGTDRVVGGDDREASARTGAADDIRLPQGFGIKGTRLVFLAEKNDGADGDALISEYPIYLKSVQTGEINGESFSLHLGLDLPNEGHREIVLPSKTFFGSMGVGEIAGRGAVIHDGELFKRYIRLSIDNYNREQKLKMQYEQFGWKGEGAFLYGTQLYTPTSVTPALGNEEVRLRGQYLRPAPGGSLERWQAAANKLFAKGCEAQAFALLCSFAAPLMRFHSTGEGGAIVSLTNEKSGTGKTTALEAVASVWGREEGLKLTDDDTRVSKGLTLGVLGNLPCTYDELYGRDPEIIKNFVLMFTNGRDKMRGTQNGEIKHTKATWQTILVLASNNSIVDILNSVDGTDAPSYRVLEFHTDIPKGIHGKGDELKRALKDNSGYAGDAYLRRLVHPQTMQFVRDGLPAWTQQVWDYTGLSNEHRFWVRTIASVIAAGAVVKGMGLLEFSPQRIANWAMEQVKARKLPLDDPFGVRAPISILSEFLHEHGNDTLVMPRAYHPALSNLPLREPSRALLVRYDYAEGHIYIAETPLRKWLVKKGVNIRSWLDQLREIKIVTRESRRITLGAGTHRASGQTPTIQIDAKHPMLSGLIAPVVVPEQQATPLSVRR